MSHFTTKYARKKCTNFDSLFYQLTTDIIKCLAGMEAGSESNLLKRGVGMGLLPIVGKRETQMVNVIEEAPQFHECRRYISTVGTATDGQRSERQTRIQEGLTLFHFCANSFNKEVVISIHDKCVYFVTN